MANSILDYVDNKEVLAYARRIDPRVFFGLRLFPARTVSELTYEYLKELAGPQAVIMGEVVGFESAAPFAPHEGLKKVKGELPPIKQKSRFSEEDVIKIFNPRSTRERQEVINRLYNDLAARVDSIHARLNWIICQSLGEGKVTFASEGTKLVVDWGLDGTQIATPSAYWSDHTNSDPVADIMAMQKVIKDLNGSFCDASLTSSTIIAHLVANNKIKQAMFGTSETSRIVTVDALNDFFRSINLPVLYDYDEKVKSVNADYTLTTSRFYPENRYSMFPSGEVLGETLYGPTAEGVRGVGVEEASGIWAEVFETRDPVNVFTMATAVAFPTFPGYDRVGIIKALA